MQHHKHIGGTIGFWLQWLIEDAVLMEVEKPLEVHDIIALSYISMFIIPTSNEGVW